MTENKTSVLAILSLVFSLLTLGLGPFGCIPGIVLGHLALSEIREKGYEGKGMAKAGLIIGYVFVILTIVVLLAFFGLFSLKVSSPTI